MSRQVKLGKSLKDHAGVTLSISIRRCVRRISEKSMKVYEPSFDEKRSLPPALNQRLWKCSWLASVIWQGWLGSLRFTCVAEHMVWQHYVRVPCANAAYLFTHLDLKRIGRSQEMFSLHWWRPPHIVVRSEAEACHGHDSVPLTQHSISSMYFPNKKIWISCLLNVHQEFNPAKTRAALLKRNKSCIEGIVCVTQQSILCFIALHLSDTITAVSNSCVKQHS